MSNYFDADVLLDTIFEVHCKECDKRKGIKKGKLKVIYEVGEAPCKSCGVNDMREYLEDAPSADVAPVVHGEWIKITDVDIRLMGRQIKEVHYKCSVCGGESQFDTNYCPHCGSKMDGELN